MNLKEAQVSGYHYEANYYGDNIYEDNYYGANYYGDNYYGVNRDSRFLGKD